MAPDTRPLVNVVDHLLDRLMMEELALLEVERERRMSAPLRRSPRQLDGIELGHRREVEHLEQRLARFDLRDDELP